LKYNKAISHGRQKAPLVPRSAFASGELRRYIEKGEIK
jgi:hypothetical protein